MAMSFMPGASPTVKQVTFAQVIFSSALICKLFCLFLKFVNFSFHTKTYMQNKKNKLCLFIFVDAVANVKSTKLDIG